MQQHSSTSLNTVLHPHRVKQFTLHKHASCKQLSTADTIPEDESAEIRCEAKFAMRRLSGGSFKQIRVFGGKENRESGGGWIRTNVAYALGLQPSPFNHSGTPPKLSVFLFLSKSLKLAQNRASGPFQDTCARAVATAKLPSGYSHPSTATCAETFRSRFRAIFRRKIANSGHQGPNPFKRGSL